MAWTSLLGGLSLANAGLGAVHGFAAPVGGMFRPARCVCAAVPPHAMQVNVAVFSFVRRLPREAQRRGARLLTGDPHANADQGVRRVAALRQAGDPTYADFGVTPAALMI